MPTKIRRARKRADEEKWKKLGLVPEYLKMNRGTVNQVAIENTGIYTGGLVQFDPVDGSPYLHPNIGRGGNDKRNAKRTEIVAALKLKYSHLWGKRGSAGIIARREQCNVRTVQKYFKDFP